MEDNQYLTFYIKDDIFALDVVNIYEIIPYDTITYIPKMEDFIEGVLNVRGNIIPIISLNKRLKLNKVLNCNKKSIIILSISYEGEINEIGVTVSKVDKVYSLEKTSLDTSPIFGTNIEKRFIKNIAKFENKFISILDIKEILNLDELSKVSNVEI
ncbi:MAG: chemotaxis protein CheW [Campylobacterota bacterium]|nr:chemotaxis protein CheW [Campylobacterota bacterium]